jgi:hypothetical protein
MDTVEASQAPFPKIISVDDHTVDPFLAACDGTGTVVAAEPWETDAGPRIRSRPRGRRIARDRVRRELRPRGHSASAGHRHERGLRDP